IHGLTSEALEGAPLFGDIAAEFSERLRGRVMVAHNAVFDWQMIAREYARARVEAPVRQRLCTIALAKELRLPLPNHTLEARAAARPTRPSGRAPLLRPAAGLPVPQHRTVRAWQPTQAGHAGRRCR